MLYEALSQQLTSLAGRGEPWPLDLIGRNAWPARR